MRSPPATGSADDCNTRDVTRGEGKVNGLWFDVGRGAAPVKFYWRLNFMRRREYILLQAK
ncbi:MAG TPA: hypothetical protein DDY78_13320 [Planctomycetales bacterium]|nr:hypothetical protein [Planctomycetales bacterium]